MPIRGVLFDKDGTLIDFEASWGPAVRALALRFAEGDETRALELMVAGGYDVERDAYRPGSVIGAGTSSDLAGLWQPGLDPAARLALSREIDAHFAAASIAGACPVCDLASVFGTLEGRGLAMGVATNDATFSAERCLEGLGLRHWFVSVIGWDGVERAKPAPDMVLAFCAAASLAPAEVAVVGDNRHDLEMAAAAGAGLKVGVLSGNSAHEDLAALADVVIRDVSHLPAVLAQGG